MIADDTYIFILLLHFCHLRNTSCNVLMASPIQGHAVMDINASAEKHRAVLPDLLAGHCLSGCVIVASHFGIGNGIAHKVLRSATHILYLLGNSGDQVPLSNIVEQATQFMLACYEQSSCLLLLKHLLELICNWQSGRGLWSPHHQDCTQLHMVGHRQRDLLLSA